MYDMILLLFGLGTTEIILIVLVVLLLFGGRKIPELMRGLGKGIKSFKDGVQGMEDENRDPKKPESGKEKKDPPQEPAG
jgi:sec-independent protein translocase protein TatA